MSYQSKNMSYIFNYEYFDELVLMGSSSKSIEDKNSEILRFEFMEKTPVTEWRQLEGFEIIELFTLYPGMLMGLGNIHEIKMEGAIKCGFNFDYTTGTPFIPGSSLKGMLRSYFPKTNSDEELIEYIKSLLPEKEKSEENELDVIDFRDKLFVGDTIYLGAYPAIDKPMSLISMEYITKHNGFKNPNPVSLN